jgi:type II secretory pathway pseudopilin PulG
MRPKLDHGQSLFEVVVAIAISALVLVVLVSLTRNAIQNAMFAKNKTIAGNYAQQASEWLRNQRDSDVENFFYTYAIQPNWCLPALAWDHSVAVPTDATSGCAALGYFIPGTIFVRWVAFDTSIANNVRAVVTVVWEDTKGTHEITNTTVFTDWRER